MNNVKVKRITVDSLEDDKSIYVYNKSEGDYCLTIYNSDGRSELIPIPKTYIPIDVCNFANAKVIKASSNFRRAVSSGVLVLIDNDEAEAILNTKEASFEIERLRKLEYTNINYEKTVDVTPMEAVIDLDDGFGNERVRDSLMRDDLGDNDTLAIILNEYNSGNLTKKDLEFIVITSNKPNTKEWAEKALNSKSNSTFK